MEKARMKLSRLRIQNFRALEEIDVEFDTQVSVIIGPNAVGKTTILDAIRLAKGVLAPRTLQETNQILQSLGAMSPHMPQKLFSKALTNKPDKKLVIKCTYELADQDIKKILELIPNIRQNLAQQNAGLAFSAPAQVVAYLSSQAGQEALKRADTELNGEITSLGRTKQIELNLTINFQTGQITGEHPIQHILFSAIEQSLPPHTTLFSYFPADRALPFGEQPVQLGMADLKNPLIFSDVCGRRDSAASDSYFGSCRDGASKWASRGSRAVGSRRSVGS
jgi:hypothetical protein